MAVGIRQSNSIEVNIPGNGTGSISFGSPTLAGSVLVFLAQGGGYFGAQATPPAPWVAIYPTAFTTTANDAYSRVSAGDQTVTWSNGSGNASNVRLTVIEFTGAETRQYELDYPVYAPGGTAEFTTSTTAPTNQSVATQTSPRSGIRFIIATLISDQNLTISCPSVSAMYSATAVAGRTGIFVGYRAVNGGGGAQINTGADNVAFPTNTFEAFFGAEGSTQGFYVTETNTPPSAPIVISPNGGETFNAIHTVSWNASTDPNYNARALTYSVECTTNGGASWFAIGDANITATSASINFTNVAASAACRVRVRTFDGYDYSTYDESNANFTIDHNSTPFAPTLVAPQNSETVDLAAGYTVQYVFRDPDAGDSQASYAFRRKIQGAGSYEYWNAGTAAFQVTEIFNASAVAKDQTGNIGFAAAKWTNGSIYNWSVASRDNGGKTGPYAADFSVTSGQAPSVSVSTPVGTQTTITRPVVAWTYSDQQNDPQATFQVKIFTETQYSAGGFDPLASTAVYNSTEIASSIARSQQPNVDLLNGGTYRAYVRVSQAGPQYSGWAFGQFVLALESPSTPRITTTYNPSTRAMNIAVQGTDNRLSAVEASFEDGSLGGFAPDTGAPTLTNSTAQFVSGTRSLLATGTAASDTAGDIAVGKATAAVLVSGRTYTVQVAVRPSYPALVRIDGSWSAPATVAAAANVWTVITRTVIANATGNTGFYVHAIEQAAAGVVVGSTVHLDNLKIEDTATTTAFSRGGLIGLTKASVEFSDDLGVTWMPLRNSTSLTLDANQAITAFDYEAPPGVVRQYRARTSADV